MLNRTLMSWDNSFLAAHIITFVVLCFGAMPSTLPLTSRDARKKNKKRLMRSIIVFVPGTWKMLPATSLSYCSRKPLMKIFWQSCLLGNAVVPWSHRSHVSSVDKSTVTVSSGTLPIGIRNLEPYLKVRESGSNGKAWLLWHWWSSFLDGGGVPRHRRLKHPALDEISYHWTSELSGQWRFFLCFNEDFPEPFEITELGADVV